MIFSPRRPPQHANHRQSCSLFLLDNILTKSSPSSKAPRLMSDVCSHPSSQGQSKKPNCPYTPVSPNFNSAALSSKATNEETKEAEETNPFNPNAMKNKRNNSDLERFMSRQFSGSGADAELDPESSNKPKGLEKFLNPLRSSAPSRKLAGPVQPQSGGVVSPKGKYAAKGIDKFREGDYSGAVFLLTRAVDTECTVQALEWRGLSYCQLGNEDMALKDILKAITLAPKNPQLYVTKYAARSPQ